MKELLQMALDALEVNYSDYIYDGAGPAIAGAFESDIAAIRSALAAPVAEVRAKSDAYGGTFVQWYSLPVAGMKLYAAPPAAPAPAVPEGDVVVSWNEDGQIVAVTRQDREGRILSVIAESAAPVVPNWMHKLDEILSNATVSRTDSEMVDAARLALKEGWALSAAPVVREPQSREQQIAIREAHCNTASDEYFGARPHIDSREDRRIYEAGFKEGWESGIGGGGK